MNNNNKTIAHNTIILAIQQVLGLIVSFYTSRVILQSLGVSDFGIYNIVAGFVSMFAFLNTSMTNATQRFYNYEYGKNREYGANKVFNCALVIQTVLAIIVIVLLECIGCWYILNKLVVPDGRLTTAFWIFQFSSFSLLAVIMQIPFSASITAHEKMACFASVNILDSLLKLSVAILIKFYEGDKLLLYGFLIFLISLSDLIIFSVYARIHFCEIRFCKIIDKKLLIQMLSFFGWNLFGSFSGVAKEQGINLQLNSFFGPVVNAARGIAYQVAGAMKAFVLTVTISGRPQLVQSYAQGNYNCTIKLMFSMSKISYLILLYFAIPITCEIDYVLDIWLDANIPSYTGTFVSLVIIVSLIESLNPPTSFVVHASGKMARYQTISSSLMLFILPVSYAFLYYGAPAESVFVLGVIFQIICQIVCILILKTIVDFSIREYCNQVILPLILISIICGLSSYFVRGMFDTGLVRLIITSCVSIALTSILTYYFVLNSSEKELIKSLLKKLFKC